MKSYGWFRQDYRIFKIYRIDSTASHDQQNQRRDPDDDADEDRDALHEMPPSVHELHGSSVGGDRSPVVRAGDVVGVTVVTHVAPRPS